jgi:hypothetical protein
VDEGTDDEAAQDGDYYGGKWGVYLRAPDIWFELLDRYGDRFKPLGEFAEIRFGVKSGKDKFFFPIDHSEKCLNEFQDSLLFRKTYGLSRDLVESGQVRLVKCGEGRGEIKPIESTYLEPEVHSLMEVDGFTVSPSDCGRMILLVGEKREDIEGTHVLDYIKWGESRGYHLGSTCAARATPNREWYDLTGHRRGAIFWPMAQQYRHIAPQNINNLICNHNLFDLTPNGFEVELLTGILNSTWVVLSKFQFGRPVGVEGNLKTEVIDVNMMLVPDPLSGSPQVKSRVAKAFERMKARKALYFLSEQRLRRMAYLQKGWESKLEELSPGCELDMPDRRELDDAVLELIGVKSSKERQDWISRLYSYLGDFFESVRKKEEKAIENKNKSNRAVKARPTDLAVQIFEEIKEAHGELLRQYHRDFLDRSREWDAFDIPLDGEPRPAKPLEGISAVDFYKGKKWIGAVEIRIPEQEALVILLSQSGQRGPVRIPHESRECARVLSLFGSFIRKREATIRTLIENRTSDPNMREKVYVALMSMISKEK